MPVADVQGVTASPGSEYQQLFQLSSSGAINTTTGGTQSIHNTNTGKTFYLTDISITADFANTTSQLIQLEATGGVVIFEAYLSNTAPVSMAGIETQPQSPSNSVLSIRWPSQAGHITYFISGYEE